MTTLFNTREFALDGGMPVRLYRFERGVARWLYCSADRDLQIGSETYKTVHGGLADAGIVQSGDPQSDQLTITGPADLEVAELFRVQRPSDEVSLTILDTHYLDTEVVVSWVGSIRNVNWPALDRCTITCLSMEASMDAPGLADTYCRTCSAVLGDMHCGVDLNAYRVTTAIEAMNGTVLQSPTFARYADGYFNAGFVEWDNGTGEFDRRHIESHTGHQIALLGGTAGISPTELLRVYPGCDFVMETCEAKFGNSLNFRGIKHLQGKSPFDGNQVW